MRSRARARCVRSASSPNSDFGGRHGALCAAGKAPAGAGAVSAQASAALAAAALAAAALAAAALRENGELCSYEG